MRYQFFLDARDYVKYSLLDDLMAQLNLAQLTLVWMLTPDAGNTHGSRRPKLDPSRQDLNAFFERIPRPGLWEVKDYYSGRGYVCNSHGDKPRDHITRANRTAYFDSIHPDLLNHALVFLDPDNGVEPRGGATPLHVRLDELASLWTRMSEDSVLMIYQHRPRVPAESFWPAVSGRVSGVIASDVLALTFGEVGFLFACRTDLRELLERERQRLDASSVSQSLLY